MGLHIDHIQDLMVEDLPALQGQVRLRGGRLIAYTEVVSLLFMCVRSYKIRWVASGEVRKSAGHLSSVLSLILGWWSFSGPFHTIAAIIWNTLGGVDVTDSLLNCSAGNKPLLNHAGAVALSERAESVRSVTMKVFGSAVLLLLALLIYVVWTHAQGV